LSFMSRMDDDIGARRHTRFLNEIKKHPDFKSSMLAPPKSKLKPVDLSGSGPIMRTHSSDKTGRERGPLGERYKWGPLGGWC